MKVYVDPGSESTLRILRERSAPMVSAVRMLIGVNLLESCSVSGWSVSLVCMVSSIADIMTGKASTELILSVRLTSLAMSTTVLQVVLSSS